MGDCRAPLRGCNWGVASIWVRRSGEAPSRNHECPSSLIATWVWLRALPLKVPARREEQLRQAQFQFGNAPPTAGTGIFMCIGAVCPTTESPRQGQNKYRFIEHTNSLRTE